MATRSVSAAIARRSVVASAATSFDSSRDWMLDAGESREIVDRAITR